MPEKTKINVMIGGRTFTVVGSEGEEYIKNLAKFVDKRMKELSSKNERLSQAMVATLAALNISDELFKNNQKLKELESKAKEPLEKYDDVLMEMEKYKEKIKELENINQQFKDEIVRTNFKIEEESNEALKLKEEIELKRLELIKEKEINKELQEKNFKNQMELVEVKKELAEFIELFNTND